MERHDDPEARIRDLEQPLTARATELGVGHHGGGDAYPPTVHHPPYGVPYPEPPRASRSFRVWWWVAGLIAVAVVIVGAGAAIYAANMVTRIIDPGRAGSVTGGGGPIDSPAGERPSIPDAGTVLAPPPGESLSVSGVGDRKRLDCNGSVVSVSGVSNTVTITGRCASLTVSGVENQVTVEVVDVINASGFDNVVTYRSGTPQITSGGSNVVQQG